MVPCNGLGAGSCESVHGAVGGTWTRSWTMYWKPTGHTWRGRTGSTRERPGAVRRKSLNERGRQSWRLGQLRCVKGYRSEARGVE
jgi:hypothetical protein